MGVWGAGLYSSDFAMDLRSCIGAVVHLPFDEDKLVDILCETEPRAANNPDDSDHAIFWLVLADQFAKRAIVCPRVRTEALAIIDTGSDVDMQQTLGARPGDLKKRRKMLDELRNRITAPPPAGKKRTVLQKPQPLLMDVGDVFTYPTAAGHCVNPYVAPENRHKYRWAAWNPDGWSACVIIDSGRAFDFLAWYRPLTLSAAIATKPELAGLRGPRLWKLQHPGTCSAVHLKRLEFEKLGTLVLNREKVNLAFPGMKAGKYAAINDISIGNQLNVAPSVSENKMPASEATASIRPESYAGKSVDSAILGLDRILAC
ncbi:MAG TPA: hypothetical protein VGM02_17855 [Acidobacteriaceae bacterium]|jgi:hypothetical protein